MVERGAACPIQEARLGLRHGLPTNLYQEYAALKLMLGILHQLLTVT